MTLKKCLKVCLMRCIVGIILYSISSLLFFLIGLIVSNPVDCTIFGLIIGSFMTGCAWADIK